MLMTERDYNDCVNKYADNVYRFIYKNLGHQEDARDIVQGAFEKMWMNREGVEVERSKSYLFTIAYNQMIDHLRKTKRIDFKEMDDEDKQWSYQPSSDHKKIVELALGSLNDVQRSLVLLKDYEGYSYAEIGQITGLNESQVKVYLLRARLHLKKYLGKIENVI